MDSIQIAKDQVKTLWTIEGEDKYFLSYPEAEAYYESIRWGKDEGWNYFEKLKEVPSVLGQIPNVGNLYRSTDGRLGSCLSKFDEGDQVELVNVVVCD
jgi:hypothetical protein